MSLSAEVTLEWADGEHLFALKGKQIEELQDKCGVGIGAVYVRVVGGVFYFEDLYHTIRLGLIGGGMGPVEAKRLTDRYIGNENAEETRLPLVAGPNSPLSVARAVLGASFHGIERVVPPPREEGEGSPLGEAGAGASPATTTSPSIERPSSEPELTPAQ